MPPKKSNRPVKKFAGTVRRSSRPESCPKDCMVNAHPDTAALDRRRVLLPLHSTMPERLCWAEIAPFLTR
eukprot:17066-Amphidinium_carterae.1